MAASAAFVEVKRRPNGTEQAFGCTLVAYDGRTALVRYIYERDFRWQDYLLPRGGRTDAWFWRDRRYLLYRMYAADGAHILDRFDVVDDVRLGRGGVAYRDLYLDVWVDGAGAAHLDDEDELAEAVAAGLLSPAEAAEAERVARMLLRRHAQIIAAAAAWTEAR